VALISIAGEWKYGQPQVGCHIGGQIDKKYLEKVLSGVLELEDCESKVKLEDPAI